jgi:hypothetical protein
LWLAGSLIVGFEPVGAAAAPQSVADAILAREAIQRELPQPQPSSQLAFQLNSELVRWLLRGGVILGAIFILMSMRGSLPAWDRSRRLDAGESPALEAGDRRLAQARLEADDLARLGRYGEAMHTLLLRAVEELRQRLRVAFADSLTSREIARRAPLDDRGRLAFAGIVGAVEAVVFGEFGADEAAYCSCRDQFEALRGSLAMAGAR